MKHLNQFITEYIIKKKLDNPIDSEHNYKYFPATRQELFKITQELIDKGQYDLNCINTEHITDMNNLFVKAPDIDISGWNVSNVKNMRNMFDECRNFTGKGLENWDVSNVTNMRYMFNNCRNFNSDLSNWDVSNVEDMTCMFYNCNSLKNKPNWYKA